MKVYPAFNKLTLNAPFTTAADDKFCDIFPNLKKNEVYFMRIVCQQTILIKYHALFIKSGKIWNCRLLQIIGGALLVKFGGFIICRKITCSIVHVQ